MEDIVVAKGYLTEAVRKQFSKHVLRRMNVKGDVEGFMLERPGYGRMESTMILFTPEGIVLGGDLCPNDNHGVMSNFGYGLNWFQCPKGASYLCSKFLTKEFVPEAAKQWVLDRIIELREAMEEDQDEEGSQGRNAARSSSVELYEQALQDVEAFASWDRFSDLLDEAGDSDAATDGPGFDYNPRDAACLCGIHDAFVREYVALIKNEELGKAGAKP